jgi:hypothetical protein
MQPPTEPTPATVTKRRPVPRGDEDELYRRHHRELHRAVALAVNAPRELIRRRLPERLGDPAPGPQQA